jgi:hypothetical protein
MSDTNVSIQALFSGIMWPIDQAEICKNFKDMTLEWVKIQVNNGFNLRVILTSNPLDVYYYSKCLEFVTEEGVVFANYKGFIKMCKYHPGFIDDKNIDLLVKEILQYVDVEKAFVFTYTQEDQEKTKNQKFFNLLIAFPVCTKREGTTIISICEPQTDDEVHATVRDFCRFFEDDFSVSRRGETFNREYLIERARSLNLL